MRDASPVEEVSKLRTAKRKGTEEDNVGQSGGSASDTRRTRSQAAPEWTAQQSLILVYEISAVEGECADALSTYQKWTIIAENCSALDVARTSNQCRRKWDSLLTEHKMIVEWEKSKRGISYWSLDAGRRKKAGLPFDFTEDLFNAINEVVKAQDERSGTDPDTDTEAEFAISIETGSKKLLRQSTHHTGFVEEKDSESMDMDFPQRSAPRKGISKERELPSMENELHRRSAHCKGISKAKGLESTGNLFKCQQASYQEHVSADNESHHQRVSQIASTEETDHMVLENESRCQAISCIGSADKEHALTDNKSQCQSTPYLVNTKVEEHIQEVCTPPKVNSEEKEYVSFGNKSCYQLTPDKAIMEGEELALLQIEPWSQSLPNEQAFAEKSVKSGDKDRKQLLVTKLQENTKLIHAISAGNSSQKIDNMPANMKYEEDMEIKRVRQNADKLIAYVADLAKNLDNLINVVGECQGKINFSV